MVKSAQKNTFSISEIDAYKSAWQNPGAVKAMINWYRAYEYSRPMMKRIIVPTLIIWGENDKFLLPEMAAKSNLMCTKGKLVMIEATHWLHHEKPAEINQLILNFL
ncbi:MAG: alpha/beta hydrolase [Sphingobacteriaceae bacterium]|nr:MAG: alpha/beta hydrolase [Sphingobacteriaceae bacterium]